MADEQQENRIIHSLLWLLGTIAVGFGISRYLAPPAYAGATVVGSIFAGSALAALVYLRGNHDRKGEKIAEPSIDQKRGSATADKAILRSSAASSVFVFLNVYRRIGDTSGPIPPSLLASVSLPDGADYLDPGQVSAALVQPSTWTFRSALGTKAEFVEIPFACDELGQASTLLESSFNELHLSGRWSRFKDLLSSAFSGQVPRHLRKLRGVVLCIPLAELRRDEGISIAALKSIGQLTHSHYPLYVVINGLEVLPGFTETFSMLGMTHPAILAQPAGVFFSELPSLDDLRQALASIVEGFAAWVPSLLFRLNESIQSTIKRLSPEKQQTWRSNQLEQQRNLLELAPQLDGFSEKIAAKLNALSTRATDGRSGPVLRGLLFSGLILKSATDIDDVERSYSLVAKTQRTFVANFLTQVLPQEMAGSERALSPRERFCWLLFFRGVAAIAAIILVLASTSAVLNWRMVRHASSLARQLLQLEPTNKDPGSMDGAIDALDSVRSSLTGNFAQSSWYEHLGFYQGERVRDELQTTYQAGIRRWLLPPVLTALENRMRGIPLVIEGGQSVSVAEASSSLQHVLPFTRL